MELSILIFLPAIAAALILLLPQRMEQQAKWVALAAAAAMFALSIAMFFRFDPGAQGYQFVERHSWVDIGAFNLQYFVGVDGLSLPLVVLTTCLTLASVLVSFSVTHRPRAYFACLLILASSVVGVFVSLDLMLFFLFWELELFPMYLLISIWGSGRKEYSATKFVLYTIAGSAFMLIGILVLAFDARTFDIERLASADFRDTLLPLGWVFFFLFVGFAVKLPIVPLHTWLPDAHSDAPTAVSVLLAGVLLKMGGYGIIRLCVTLMPEVAHDWDAWMAGIGAFSVLYGGFITLRQTDVKRLIAYSSVSHMGLVLLGIGALGSTGLTGATYQMLAHGLITGLMFVMIGLMYERTHTREIARLGGLARQMPLIATGMVFAGMASLGLPALAGFIAEVTVFLGAFQRFEWAVLAAIIGVVLSAGYILWMLQRVMFGPVRHEWDELTDQRHWWEHAVVAGLAALVILLGVYPALLMDVIEPAMTTLAARLQA
ncbi:NADH-quinone oxidoreductase subunit M [Tepidiforma flava]|uniref:NADH-quinone oxidoreductase subunit M n=1 Tax=Tepidiforma flava TaxID=3004094 RepID=A0ABY7M627_9CHLR|nr:NADH-quinone oxidoreductase subunit M [Tepidiforma flava]WBL35992.1 NADH-quinone oxidoreductase subunit M [Tepidiforma flava]